MKIFQSIKDFKSDKKTILTLGTFDGVHLGHKAILEKLVLNAHETDCESTVLTFFPHPRMVLQQNSDLKLLNSIEEKIELLEKIGIQNLIIHPFDTQFSQLSAEAFVKTILVEQLHIQKIIIGYDHRFGKNRTANIEDLILYGKELNFEVEQISAQEIDDISISSTKIRTALAEGTVDLANQYLGYNYFLTGKVITGKKLGRTIGFPTANLELIQSYKLIPKQGVYVVSSIINEKKVFGMMNIGLNPTVGGTNLSIEVHFFDFDQDIYNQTIVVEFLCRIRSEQKFGSLELLIKQLESDREFSINFLTKTNN